MTRERNCPKHGAYTSATMIVKDREVETTCPACFESFTKEFDVKRIQEINGEIVAAKELDAAVKSNIPKRYASATLYNFEVVTPEYQKPLDAARAFLGEILSGKDEHMALLGKTGVGKTHLACAIAKAYVASGHRALWIKASVLADRVREGLLSGRPMSSTIPEMIGDGLLVLDEVGSFGSEKEFVVSVVSEAIDYCDIEMLPVLLVSNLDINGLKDALQDRASDRMNNGRFTIVTMGYESYRSKQHG